MPKFGSDYRLVGEATITGLKYDAREPFWSTLAHTDIIGRIGRLVEHYGALSGNLDRPIVWDREELLSWLQTTCWNCLNCYPYGANGPEPQESHARFGWELLIRLQAMNICWKEFALYFGSYLHDDSVVYWKSYPDETNFKTFGPQGHLFASGTCIAPVRFIEILDDLVQNRVLLSQLPPASKTIEPNLWTCASADI